MIWESIVGGLLGKVAPAVAEYYQQKQEQKHKIEMAKMQGKLAWEQAKTRRAEISEGHDHDWEMQSMVIHTKGWKDEFVLIVVSIPMIGAFIPQFRPYVAEGFDALSMTPWWYQALLTAIFFAVYGMRVWRRDALKKNLILEGPNGAQ